MPWAAASAGALVVALAAFRARTRGGPKVGLIASCMTVVLCVAPLLGTTPSLAAEHPGPAAGGPRLVLTRGHEGGNGAVDPGPGERQSSIRRVYDSDRSLAQDAGALLASGCRFLATRPGAEVESFTWNSSTMDPERSRRLIDAQVAIVRPYLEEAIASSSADGDW